MARELEKLSDGENRRWMKLGLPDAKADGGALTYTLSTGGTAAWVLRYHSAGSARELILCNSATKGKHRGQNRHQTVTHERQRKKDSERLALSP